MRFSRYIFCALNIFLISGSIMKELFSAAIIILFGSVFSTFAADEGAVAGKELYDEICSNCHGSVGEGDEELNAPAIAGQENWYLTLQLKNLKLGVRGANAEDVYGGQMRAMAMTLSNDEDIENVAAYITSLKRVETKKTISGNASQGKVAYSLCSSCHGLNGEGNKTLNAPALNGQSDWYIVRQLQMFKSGVRGGDPRDIYGAQMHHMAKTLQNDQAVHDVTTYIATLKGLVKGN